MAQLKARPWAVLFTLYRGKRIELAKRLQASRVALHNLIKLQHATAPHDMLKALAEAFAAAGMADGSEPPDQAELFRAWTWAKRKARAGAR